MKLNWKLIVTSIALLLGIYLLIVNRPTYKLTGYDEHKRRSNIRIGIILIIASICGFVYLYYTDTLKFSASMPNDCDVCKIYGNRRSSLRPYNVNEISTLRQHADACKTCSDKCFKYITLLQQNPPNDKELMPFYRQELQEQKASCAQTTENAILSSKELERVGAKLRSDQTRFWAAAHNVGAKPTWHPFPKVPTHKF